MLGRPSEVPPDQVAAYIRWSTEEQGQGTTLDVQRDRVRMFVQSQGWLFSEDLVFVDDGYSGGTMDRPGLSALREAVRSGRVRCVVVYRLDRLSRSLRDTVNLVRGEWHGRAVLCSATEHFDTHSPVGQMIFNILASFAEFERNLIRERTLSGKRKRAEQGRNAGQRYPWGYRKGAGGAWALDGWDEECSSLTGPAAMVRRIFEAFLSGMSTGAIARMLNGEGRATPQGRPWRFHYISRILRNPLYTGEYRYGRRTRSDSRVSAAAPAIVPAAEFQRVQELLRRRCADRSPAMPYLLSGLARCSRCDSPLAGSRARTKRYYVCTGRTMLHRCDCAYLPADPIEAAVLQELRQHAVAQSAPWRPDRLLRWWEEEVAARQKAVLGLEQENLVAGRRRHRAENEFLGGRLDGQAFSRLSERLTLEEGEVYRRLEQAREALITLQLNPVNWAGRITDCDPWAEVSPDEVRQILRLLTGSLTLYRTPGSDSVQIFWAPRQKAAAMAPPL